MLDFGLLPPDINSVLMYSGPGSESTMVAASAWDALAAELDSFAQGCTATIESLQDEGWAGPASNAMAAAAAPFAEWATTTAAQAEQAAGQARSAASAFEAAHAATVPPPMVAANRTLLAHLIATNVLGQNTSQIAATEAAYHEMWVQDAHAMYGYAASASSATKLPPFKTPPTTTNPVAATAASAAPAAAASQSALAQFLSSVPQLLSAGSNAATTSSTGIPVPEALLNLLSLKHTLMDPFNLFVMTDLRNVGAVGDALWIWIRIATDGAGVGQGMLGKAMGGLTGATSPAGSGALSPGVLAGAAKSAGIDRAVLAGVGKATAIGQLSAPPAWANTTPVAAATDSLLSSWGSQGSWDANPKVEVAGTGRGAAMAPMAGAAGAAAAGKIQRPSVSTVLQVSPPRYEMPRHTAGG